MCECCAAGGVAVFRCSSISKNSLCFVAHFCRLHSLGSVLPYLFLFSTAGVGLVLPVTAAVNKSESLQTGISHTKHNSTKLWVHQNQQSASVNSFPRWQTGKKKKNPKQKCDKKFHNLRLLSLPSFGFANESDWTWSRHALASKWHLFFFSSRQVKSQTKQSNCNSKPVENILQNLWMEPLCFIKGLIDC